MTSHPAWGNALAAGTIGLIALARNGIILPFCIIVAHYLAWCFVPIFAGVAFRTYPYLIPFLALGAAYFIISAFKSTSNLPLNNKVLALIASGLLLAHISTQIPDLRSKTLMKNSLPEFWASYYTGQGELRPVISEIEKILPTNATLLTWGYGLKFLYRDLKTNDLDVDLPVLNALMLRQNVGLLKSHIKKRHLAFPSKAPIYILVDHEIDHINRQTLRLKVSALLGPNGFSISENADIENIAMWQLKSSWPRNVTLYKVVLKGP